MLAGTNNLGAEDPSGPEEVARGVAAIVRSIRSQSPSTRVIWMALPPISGATTAPIQITNERMAALAVAEGVEWFDTQGVVADTLGGWKPGFTLDGTHFSAAAYRTLADALRPAVARHLEAPSESAGEK